MVWDLIERMTLVVTSPQHCVWYAEVVQRMPSMPIIAILIQKRSILLTKTSFLYNNLKDNYETE